MESKLIQVVQQLKKSKKIVAFTGAGISAESGIATFRGNGGLWGKYRIEEVATPQAFYSNPELVWDFYLERRQNAKDVQPNQAHITIAQWEKVFPFVGVVTQNVDGLHARAGSTNVQELHGNLWKIRCTECDFLTREEKIVHKRPLPICSHCGKLLRPHIVWFGEQLEFEVVQKSVQWMREADLIFVVGTSGVVEPAAGFVRDARMYGAFIVEVNLEETALTHVANVSLFGKSAEIFGCLSKLLAS